MDNSQTQQVIVVSGGSRGLGEAIVNDCLQAGYRVATFSRSATPFIERTIAADPERERFMWESVDGRDSASIKAFIANVLRRFGRVDGLVNNAGVGVDGILATMRVEQIEQGIELNLNAAIHLVQACSRAMLQQKSGSIVNVSSVNAVRGHSGVSVYSASKAALDGLTRSLARELGPKRIRVNSVAPGYFESSMVEHLSDQDKRRIVRRTPLGRLGHTRDVVETISFLLSAQSSFITGQTIVVDGGLTC